MDSRLPCNKLAVQTRWYRSLRAGAAGKLHARSAGPDKTFGTPDDISGDKDLGPP